MTPSHPTALFTALACMLGLGAWSMSPLEAPLTPFADEFSFLGISNGKNVLSGLSFLIVGFYGLTRRPRFDLGRDVLVSMALSCVGFVAMGGLVTWYHYDPSLVSRLSAHLAMSMVVMNGAFALISAQLPLRGRWWLLVASQFIAFGTASYEFWYEDKRYLLMSQLFLVLLVMFSLVRVWRHEYSRLLAYALVTLGVSALCGYLDRPILKMSAYSVSGHTLQQLLWSLAGLLILRFLVVIRPSELSPTQLD